MIFPCFCFPSLNQLEEEVEVAVDITSSGKANSSIQRGEAQVQAPLVDSSIFCHCKVDAGLRTVVAARKFVPGARSCLQQDATKSRGPEPSRRDRAAHVPLLPGLPDDLAIACLIRVPRADHRNLHLVSRRWHRLLAGNYFYSLRKKHGTAEEWVYVVKRDGDGKISLQAFDPTYQAWHPLPPVPAEYSEALGFGCAVLNGSRLYFFGGKDPSRGPVRRVVCYNARTNRWHRAPDMLHRRYCFGSCVVNNRLYVAGGESEGIPRAMRSAEVFDPDRNRWSPVADMSTSMIPFAGVVHDGKWFLRGLAGAHRRVKSEVYAPATNSWSAISEGMAAGWRNPSVSMGGQLYAVDCEDGCRLRVYDGASDSWNRFIDSKLHLGSSHALQVAALLPLNGKLCIIRNNMGITLVDVSNGGKNGPENESSGVWETIARKGKLRTFVANLWSSIARRGAPKSKIIHCQVLQA